MNKELLIQLYSIHSKSGQEKRMRSFIKRYISRECGEVAVEQDRHGNLLCTKGVSDTYPCLAAHMDQVQCNHSKDFTVVEGGGAMWGYSPKCRAMQGIGGDDKNGIFIALECLRMYDVLKVAFFVGEEIGCVGSYAVDLSFFSDCRFIVQPDRRGSRDLITSMYCGSVCSDDFVQALNAAAFGYVPEHGSVTDVGTLVERGVGISCLNVSCGYYEPHTDREFTVLADLQNCLDFVCHIIEYCTDVYPFAYEDPYCAKYSLGHHKCYDGWPSPEEEYYQDGWYDDDYGKIEDLMDCMPDMPFSMIRENMDYFNAPTFFLKADDAEDALQDIYDSLRKDVTDDDYDLSDVTLNAS